MTANVLTTTWRARVQARQRGWQLGALLALLCSMSAPLGHARAQDEDQAVAKERFQRGVSEYESGQYGEALADFQEAYRLKPHPLVRVNIANCYDKMDRPVEAIFHFELFMSSKQGSAEQRAEIKEALKGLRKRVGKLVLSVTPDGARITIDESEERRAPVMEPITLKAGLHEVSVALEGYETLKRTVNVAPESSTELTLRLTRPATAVLAPAPMPTPEPAAEPAPEPAPVAAAEPAADTVEQPAAQATPIEEAPPEAIRPDEPPRKHARGVPSAVWIAGGTALVLATVGTVTGLMVGSAEQEFDDSVSKRFDPTLSSLEQSEAWNDGVAASDRAQALAVTTDVLFGAAIVSAAIAVYFYLSDDSDEAQAQLTPLMTPGGASARFHF